MLIHIAVFAILGMVFLGWRLNLLPYGEAEYRKARSTFLMLAAAGNFLGLVLSFQNLDNTVPEGFMLEKTEDYYDEAFLLSVDGGEAFPFTVEVPQTPEAQAAQQGQAQISEQQRRAQELMDVLDRYNEEKEDPEHYYLPDKWEGHTYRWSRPRDNSGALLSSLFLVAATAVLILNGREKQTLLAKRQEALLMDYPELIMKFTLFVAAGMTVRNAFMKIASDERRKHGTITRPAYDAIATACNEMDSGISEAEAYYRFGERCGQVHYKTFATLLLQNLQKGSRQLVQMLERESSQAWDERKQKAKILGDTASTRLLFPMILMLGVVMAIIMIPAALSFYGTG